MRVRAGKITVIVYQTQSGKHPYREWLNGLQDQTVVARIRARIDRVEQGNLGDHKSVGLGLMELRFTFGSGYRVYFGFDGAKLVVLLAGGDKRTQKKDIKHAHEYWADYVRRK